MYVAKLSIDPPVAGQCANAKASRGGWLPLKRQDDVASTERKATR